jgi:hypothetical protein
MADVHVHDWQETSRRTTHAGERIVTYVRCAKCQQIGYRYSGSNVVYTWEQA